MYTAKSFLETGNLTRGEFGVKPVIEKVIWDVDGWRKYTSRDKYNGLQFSWGAFDPDFGWMAPWNDDDVVECRVDN